MGAGMHGSAIPRLLSLMLPTAREGAAVTRASQSVTTEAQEFAHPHEDPGRATPGHPAGLLLLLAPK